MLKALPNATLFLCLAITATPALSLSPPWQLFRAEVDATLGADPCVHVDPLVTDGDGYLLSVREICGDLDKADGLATLMSGTRILGSTKVVVQVLDAKGRIVKPLPFPQDPDAARSMLNATLLGNPYYAQIAEGNPYYDMFVELRKEVVQYFGDNKSDGYNNINTAAALAFLDVLNLNATGDLRIGTSTAIKPQRSFNGTILP